MSNARLAPTLWARARRGSAGRGERWDAWFRGLGSRPGQLLKQHLLDVLDISIYPLLAGRGKPFLREGQNANLRLITTKSFSKGIVKLTYEPQY